MSTNLLFIILIIAVVAMVVGPLMMLQPTTMQRRQEQLRARAAQLGLRVKITSLPQQATDAKAPEATPAYYLPRQEDREEPQPVWLLLRGAYSHETNFFEQWVWYGAGRPNLREQVWLRATLGLLPPSVLAIGHNPEGACVYWTEADGLPTLERLA